MRNAVLTTIGTLSILLFPSSLEAKVGDRQWADCVWSEAPESAAAWINMTMPNWQTGFDETPTILAHRLYAICNETSVMGIKSAKNPNWKSLSRTLKRAKPKTLAQASATSVQTLRCSSYVNEEGSERLFLVDVVRRTSSSDIVVLQQFFGFLPELGKRVMVPPGFKVVPKDVGNVRRQCQQINPDGSLSDA